MIDKSQEHFDRIAERYQRSAESWQIIYDQVEARINPVVKDRVVLDVGNGGRFPYDVHLPSRVICMDIAPAMLEKIQEASVEKVVCDAKNMDVIPDESVDIVVFQLVLHHINGSNVTEALQTLDTILAQARRKIRPGGRLMITEGFLSPFVFATQSALFPVTRFILGRFGIPMIFFFTLKIMKERIAKEFRLEGGQIEEMHIPMKDWHDPLGGSFPGLIKIPPWLQPWDYCLLIVPRS